MLSSAYQPKEEREMLVRRRKDARYRAALQEVNRIRAARGMPRIEAFPRGVRYTADACPATKALGAVSAYRNIVWPGYTIQPTPEPIVAFMQAFDDGAYPELEVHRRA